jgi:multiple RNA-binding domain-containing protein 1
MKKRTRPSQDASALLKTRLCLKNLPKNVTSSQLQSFLKTRLPTLNITDAKVLQNRQMAFVGVSTEQEAHDLMHQYNRAYFQTSRITVEYAIAPKNFGKETEKAKETFQKESISKNTATEKQLKEPDKRKLEYLAVMGAGKIDTQPKKSWANDDGGVIVTTSKLPSTLPNKSQLDDESKNGTDDHSDDDSDDDSSSSSSDEDKVDPLEKQPKSSDLDFLKAKTIQVDDLDIDHDIDFEKHADNKADQSDSSSSIASSSSESLSLQQEQAEQITNSKETGAEISIKTEINDACRLFLRNLPFVTNSDDILKLFEKYSPTDVHLPVDDQKNSKGFGFVTLANATDAQQALQDLDGIDFQGRLLHILPAKSNPNETTAINDTPHMNYKQKQELQLRQEAMKNTTGWSASYLRGDAVIDTLAERLGLRKSLVLNVKDGMSGGDAAVRLALGETALIEENRKYFAEHGIDMDALVSVHRVDDKATESATPAASALRSNTSLLVKNLPADTTETELVKVFGSAGEAPKRILLPPSRTIAMVEYSHMNDAKSAFKRLAYKRFKSVPIYLEWAPLVATNVTSMDNDTTEEVVNKVVHEDENDPEDAGVGLSSTLFVKNLNFSTSEERLREFLSAYSQDIRSIRLPKKLAPTKRTQVSSLTDDDVRELSLGYGFVEFASNQVARRVIKDLQGAFLDGHGLELVLSKHVTDAARTDAKTSKKSAKLMIRNVPFQASRKELMQLFGSFGQLKKVRLPKKFAGGHRGFCFIEYLTPKDAAAAMASLSRTHLYGRHLVIEWATADDEENGLSRLREKAERDLGEETQRANKKIRFN